MKSKFLLTLFFSFLLITPTSATSVNLTSLSQGAEASHNHLLVETYSTTHHWQECSICFAKFDEDSHSLSSTTTMGTSCSEDNFLIITCEDCSYFSQSPANYPHTGTEIYRGVLGDLHGDRITSERPELWSMGMACTRCGLMYNKSADGYLYKYADGTEVDPLAPKRNVLIYTQDGYSAYLGRDYKMFYQSTETSTIKYTLSANGNLNIIGSIYLPPNTGIGTMDSYVYILDLHKNSPTTACSIGASPIWNSTDRTMSFNVSFPVKDMTKDYTTLGRFTCSVAYNSNNDIRVSQSPFTSIPLNLKDVVVQFVYYEV